MKAVKSKFIDIFSNLIRDKTYVKYLRLCGISLRTIGDAIKEMGRDKNRSGDKFVLFLSVRRRGAPLFHRIHHGIPTVSPPDSRVD